MILNQKTLNAQRCALIWFSISSKEVLEALNAGRHEDIRHLGLDIDVRAFEDVSTLIRKDEFASSLLKVNQLWSIQCSPRPCALPDASYPPLLEMIEKCFEPDYRESAG